MFEKWSKYKAVEVLSLTDNNGNRLISSFAKDYKSVFGQEICPTCNGFDDKFQKFLKKTQTMNTIKNESGYVLKKMYENIPLKFGSSVYVNNQNLTKKFAEELLKNHPRGKDLFDAIPNDLELPLEVIDLINNNSIKQLIELAKKIGVENPKGSKEQLANIIYKAKNADVK